MLSTGLGNQDSSPPSIQIALLNSSDVNRCGPNPQFEISLNDNVGLMFSNGSARAELVVNDTLKIGIAELVNMEAENFKQGKFTYTLAGLKPGGYTLTLNCWDTNNNPTQASFKFQVVDDTPTEPGWLVYPNPMEGIFKFKIEQPATWSTWKAQVRLYNVIGQRLHEREFTVTNLPGNEIGFTWEWTEAEKKLANGPLLCEIMLENDEKKILGPFRSKIITPK